MRLLRREPQEIRDQRENDEREERDRDDAERAGTGAAGLVATRRAAYGLREHLAGRVLAQPSTAVVELACEMASIALVCPIVRFLGRRYALSSSPRLWT